jgi:hypothetical protein
MQLLLHSVYSLHKSIFTNITVIYYVLSMFIIFFLSKLELCLSLYSVMILLCTIEPDISGRIK